MSSTDDQPAPSDCEVRGSSELYVRTIDSGGPTVVTLASVTCWETLPVRGSMVLPDPL